MSSSDDNQGHYHDQDKKCPECRHQYDQSSESEESVQERLIIPIRKDLLTKENTQIQVMLAKLQAEVEGLKKSNRDKDRMIEDLKKEIEHKMTHYALYGELSKQAGEISRLRDQISQQKNMRYSRGGTIDAGKTAGTRHAQFRDTNPEVKTVSNRALSESDRLQKKIHSTYENYNTLRKQFMKERRKQSSKTKQKQLYEPNEYYHESKSPVFKIAEAKKKIDQLQSKVAAYQKQLKWMSSFVTSFVHTMEAVAWGQYQEQILAPEWGLKKKAKTCWRYLKHLFVYFYQSSK